MSVLEKKSFPADLDSLEGLRDYVLAAAAKTKLSKKKVYKLELAVEEIATNVILYGCQEHNIEVDVVIEAELTEQSLVITLIDQGVPFNPKDKELPNEEDLAKSLDERPIGGLGIFLARTGVDRFNYERQDEVNVNIFEVFLKDND